MYVLQRRRHHRLKYRYFYSSLGFEINIPKAIEADDPKGKRPVEYYQQNFLILDTNLVPPSEYYHIEGNDLSIRGEQLGKNGNQRGGNVSINHATLDDNDVMSMMFDTMEEAKTFYLLFARATGFSVQKGYKFADDNERVRYRQWVCSREGQRDPKHMNREDKRREPRPNTRVDCQATLKNRYALEEDKYVVSEFLRLHTHKLACPSTTIFLKCHRKVSDTDTHTTSCRHED